ncbi:MAG TPA: DUF2339 domain-containing protein [Gemmatimonadetes bacterium]|nr:DUF2339 domain-containing protein [Gemmatimonadota bacterium]
MVEIFTVVALVIAFVALRRTKTLSDEIKLLRRAVDHFPLQESGEEIDFQEKDVEAASEEASDAIVDEPRKSGDVIGGPDFSPPTPLSTESLEPQTPQINCPECGQEFEVSRTSCPACGCPVAIAQYDSSSDETVAVEPAKAAIDIETQIGTTWLLRIGLVVLAIALALFARNVAPALSNGAKVGITYAGSLLLFSVGKFYEVKLERFARPVMAAGLSFGFFVAYAAYFVPAMQAVSLSISIVWMIVSMLAVLLAAERWRSEYTAGLAILLGHISAFVAGSEAEMYSLVMIVALAALAIMLLLRHRWVVLGVFAVVVSYGSHLLWILTDLGPVQSDLAFWLNLAFLTSYYALFLVADILWWQSSSTRVTEEDEHTRKLRISATQLGPTNLVLYTALASFVFFMTETDPWVIEWYFLSLALVQGALAWLYRGTNHLNFVFYAASGTVLWTLGLFAALDALVLNLVLAGQALLLLFVAHRTRIGIFHGLAQVATLVAFVHYLAYPPPATSTWPLFLGGLGLVAVYLFMASLEEVWYGDRRLEDSFGKVDSGDRPRRPFSAEDFSRIAPYLPFLHAALGGFVLSREAIRYFESGTALVLFLSAAHMILVGLVLNRGRIALLFGSTAIAYAPSIILGSFWNTLVEMSGTPILSALIWLTALTGSSALLAHFAQTRITRKSVAMTIWHGKAVVALVLLGSFAWYLGPIAQELAYVNYLWWMVIPILSFVFLEGSERAFESIESPPQDDQVDTDEIAQDVGTVSTKARRKRPDVILGVILSVASAILVITVTDALLKESAASVVSAPVWIAAWSLVLLGAAVLRRSLTLFTGGYVLLVAGYLYFLVGDPGAEAVLSSWWAGAIVTLLPIGVALALDRFATILNTIKISTVNTGIYLTYGIGLLLLGGFSHYQLDFGWSFFASAVAGLILFWLAGRLKTDRAVPSVVAGLVVLHLAFLWRPMELLGRSECCGSDIQDGLLALSLFALVTLVAERMMPSAMREGAKSKTLGYARFTLVALATATTMLAIYGSNLFGTLWATAGWAILAALLMTAGFVLKSAWHRRVGLLVLASCLLRVFMVDTRSLSDTAQIAAFLVLGLCLVGAAWLYTRYSEELKNWL